MRILWCLALAAVTVACGPQPSPASQGDGSQPKPGGVLKLRDTRYYTTLDPTQAQRAEAGFLSSRVFDSLLSFKSDPNQPYDEPAIEPRLAERWEAGSEGKSFTFHLRRGVKFANLPPVNGREVTSADLKWSFEYIARTGPFKEVKFPRSNQIAFKLHGMERVETPDPHTGILHFKEPYAPFVTYAATPELAVMPHEVYNQDGDFNERPVGTGPWQLDKAAWKTDALMVFKKNPDYWEAGKPYVDEVHNIVLVDDAAAVAAFQAKQLDIFAGVDTLSDAERLQSGAPEAGFVRSLGWNALRFYYNVNVPPFTDVRFRRAMLLATDKEEFVRTFTRGQGSWAMNGGVPGVFSEEEMKALQPYDPEGARRLLRQSGYTENPIVIETLYSPASGKQLLSDIELLQSQLKRVGIQIDIAVRERTEISSRYRSGNYMMAPNGTGRATDPEPDNYFYIYFHPASGTNLYHVNDPKLTGYAEAQRRETDPVKRKELWRQQARYINEMGYALWIYHAPTFDFWQPYVRRFHPNVGTKGNPTPDTWMDR